jgi:hypothetical protein
MSRTFRTMPTRDHVHTMIFDGRKGREVCTSCPKNSKRRTSAMRRAERAFTRTEAVTLTVTALRAACKAKGLSVPARLRKAELIALLSE